MTLELRADLRACLTADEGQFRRRADLIEREYDIEPTAERSGTPAVPDWIEPTGGRERELIQRLRRFDSVPLGLTLSGPAYQDNPIRYVNRTFTELTGYSRRTVRGENPRFLQGPETEPEAVADLHEAIDIWEATTVELWNYRADGSRFRNRVSVVPVEDDSGMITNWLGIQAAVDDVPADSDAESRSTP